MLLRHGILPAILLWLLLFTSCDHKELYIENYNQYKVHVTFNFSNVKAQPEAMRVLFYPLEADSTIGAPYIFDLDATGGIVNLPIGIYHVLSYNVDTETILEVDDDKFNDFKLTTSSTEVESFDTRRGANVRNLFGSKIPKAEKEESFLLYTQPEWVCRCRVDSFMLKPTMITKTDEDDNFIKEPATTNLLLEAKEVLYTINIELEGIQALPHATMAKGTLSGVSISNYIAQGKYSSETGMVAFDAYIDKYRNKVTASFLVWGPYPADNNETEQYLDIYIWTSSGNYYTTTNVTELMHAIGSKEMERNVKVKTEINLDDGGDGNSGFHLEIGEWGDEKLNVTL